jgi:hypothetical protein
VKPFLTCDVPVAPDCLLLREPATLFLYYHNITYNINYRKYHPALAQHGRATSQEAKVRPVYPFGNSLC